QARVAARIGALRTGAALLAFALAITGCARADAPAQSARLWSAVALAELQHSAEAAPLEGLPSEQTALAEITRFERLAENDPIAAAQSDAAADALFSSLARSFAQGATDPARADPQWQIPPPPPPDLEMLLAARAAGASPVSLLQGLLPRALEYRSLRATLARTIAEAPDALDDRGLDRETRVTRLRANMERWRWLPRELPERRLEARIAQFQTILYRPGSPPIVHAAIVGARRTPTPSFAANIVSVTLNPTWEPPQSILRNELLPRFGRDPSAVERENFEVIDWSGNVLDPASIDWSERPFRHRLRQRPGPGNALGQIRFDLPNPYSIYLHDTSNRSLFSRSERALSHGCIRVENIIGLAAAVIANPVWDHTALQAAIADGQTRPIALTTPMPVYMLYLTALAKDDGDVVYFDDIYHRDAAVVAALDAPAAPVVVSAVGAPAQMPRCAA
ncbi:MAG: L,D-transpeptidase family protein, partial [Terricaulis sp.]